jgi:two-component system, NtrC family, response regulator AtoC
VPVNCAAIIETLIESELFGHQKASFTGANRRHPGLIERANGGTLFLDEISEMRSEAQAKLLRFIQERRVLPVGATQEIPIDVRFLAASNRAPKQAIGEERLHADLYYRLNATAIHLPPLRDRLEDLPVLIDHFIEEANRDFKKEVDSIDPEFLAALKTHHWPGNVRELRHVFESAVLMTHSTRLWDRHFKKSSGNTSGAPSNSPMETRPEHRRCWASLAGLYTENSSATTLGTNPTADPTATDTARRATIEAA